MNTYRIGDIFITRDQKNYLIIIGDDNNGISILKTHITQMLPSGGEVIQLTNEEEFNSTYLHEYTFSHHVDVTGWLAFKKQQIFKILKG